MIIGKIISVDDLPNSRDRAIYEYIVDGKIYRNRTNWTSYCLFITGGDCYVFYDVKDPRHSYIKYSGQYVHCLVGIVFTIVGLGVLLMGAYLSMFSSL